MTLVRAKIEMVGSQKCIMETGNTSIPSDSEISNNLILSHCWQKCGSEAVKKQKNDCDHKISGHGAQAG